MELIAKVTSRCDMACSFCSASNLSINDLTPQEIVDTVEQIHASSIILLGGEALLMGPKYYEKLLSIIPDDISLDFTTNLKDFYLHPDRWTDLFLHPRVHVCTSFNYGNTRRWDKDTPLSEERFKEIMRLFEERIGYMPTFIAVIDKNNIDTWRKHIELAKELHTKVRLNNAMAFGRQTEYFSRAKLFAIWVQIVKEGLDRYEVNTSERNSGRCPYNTCLICNSTIRVMSKRNGKLIYYTCDDKSNLCLNPMKTIDEEPLTPVCRHIDHPLFSKCYACQLFRICNGCETNVSQIEDKEEYCNDMLAIKDDIIKYGWKL